MKVKKSRVALLAKRLGEVCVRVRKEEREHRARLEAVHPDNRRSARNLLHYLRVRANDDLRQVQDELAGMGLSGLGDMEGHILAGLLSLRDTLRRLLGKKDGPGQAPVTPRQADRLLRCNTRALFGHKLKGSPTRIMVTLPSDAADQPGLVRQYVLAGMNAARVNCAHDGPEAWLRMIAHVRRARRKTGRNCRVAVDLGGPKIRTGALAEGPRVLHLHPARDAFGRVVGPVPLQLVAEGTPAPPPALALDPAFVDRLQAGDTVLFTDARGKKCRVRVAEAAAGRALLPLDETVFLVPGTPLTAEREGRRIAAALTGDLPPLEQRLTLREGDTLLLLKDPVPGEPAVYAADGTLARPARIACTAPEIFADVKPGDPILFDDGKIEGLVTSAGDDGLHVKILATRGEAARLGADKGINLPATRFGFGGLTAKDRADLAALAKKVDVVNLSFVNGPEDVEALRKALRENGAAEAGIILKIETRQGFENLPAILLAALKHHPVGVMLARGDLAVECGWENLAPIQEEILRLCGAAHVPVVWATQVLETSAQKGIPTRAEITDAAMAERAECVMLNKGPHIRKTIALLERILTDMRRLRHKAGALLPPLSKPDYDRKPGETKKEKKGKEAKKQKGGRLKTGKPEPVTDAKPGPSKRKKKM
ncbi:MAG: hypothetical protein KA419_07310 [Acidobacteria bacterium]|nr:hypothetical protein [Acidobacteriota bacterium]